MDKRLKKMAELTNEAQQVMCNWSEELRYAGLLDVLMRATKLTRRCYFHQCPQSLIEDHRALCKLLLEQPSS